MICSKCNSKNEYGNFCSNCAHPLKEKCDECGQMERIGRLVCEQEYKKARAEKLSLWDKLYVAAGRRTRVFLRILFCLMGGLMFAVILLGEEYPFILDAFPFKAVGIVFVTVLFLFLGWEIIYGVQRRSEKVTLQIEEEFPKQFPRYAEILKKAEGGEK